MNFSDNKPIYIEGVGFRCETEHTMKRWANWKDARKPGTYFVTLSVAAHQNVLGKPKGSVMKVWTWLREHPEAKNACMDDPFYMKHAVVGERRLPFCRVGGALALAGGGALPSMAKGEANSDGGWRDEANGDGGWRGEANSDGGWRDEANGRTDAKQRPKVVLPLEGLMQDGAPEIVLTPLGKEVERCWYEMSVRYPAIETIMLRIMPNHLHAVVCVNKEMEKTLGDAIAGFMRGTTMALRRMLVSGEAQWSYEAILREIERDKEDRLRIFALREEALTKLMEEGFALPNRTLSNMAKGDGGARGEHPCGGARGEHPCGGARGEHSCGGARGEHPCGGARGEHPCGGARGEGAALYQRNVLRILEDKGLPQIQRAGSKRRRGREQTPDKPSLWEERFVATVCGNEEQLNSRLVYTAENPFFKVLESVDSQLFERRLHLTIAGKDYATYGNLFLLKEAEKLQVFCHRMARIAMLTDKEVEDFGGVYSLPSMAKDRVTRVPYIFTEAYRRQKDELLAAGCSGAVLVTPGISPGECDILHSALASGINVILIQADPISSEKWHPGKTLRMCCSRGRLLLLAPWQAERKEYKDCFGRVIPSSTDYAHFHDLNEVAAEICRRGDDCAICRKR